VSIRIELPYPPTVNHYWKRRHGQHSLYIAEAGKRYREDVLGLVLVANPARPVPGRLSVVLELHPPDRRRRDLDNTFKGLLDALTHARVYEDDSQIDHLEIDRLEVRKGGLVIVTITELQGAA
jgi:crossover junction endodeoxyribonuclease RusA